ncbi:efflux transporter outer membrane subunit [Sphingomonas quercus]|uniref:Efflux transporter outer membrane subunit n=1 Tax=Sphingomonas quercus TaxID=2842451 RepID=A0ABS6BHL3_9SPHN|nr:efflux transporter outer membrane subunit [Sphingomonas quercus]MBU3077790.1 efflux transporter outer membrane subunit [Sphingomonas quercus]
MAHARALRRVARPAFAAAITALLLAGCAAIPDDGPRLTALSADKLGIAQGPDIPPATNWWAALGDAQLDRIMADALAGSPRLAAAAARVAQAQAGIAIERAALQPQLGIDAEEVPQRLSEKYIIPPPYGGTGRWVGTAQANLGWSLDLAGKQKAAIEGARATAQAAALDVEAARVMLTGAIAQTYVNLARAELQKRIADEFVASREQSLGLTRTRVTSQLASDIDLRTAETLLADARRAAVRADGERALMVHALAALAGRGPDYYPTIAATQVKLDAALPVPDALPADLIGRRPDILAARARIESADANRRVARADFYPDVNIKAFIGLQALGIGNLFSTGAAAFGAGPAVHLPIFEGGRLKAGYQGAVAGIDVAIADYNAAVLGAVKEAADALSSIDSIAGQAVEQRGVVTSLGETVRLNEVRLRTGLAPRVDLLASGDRLLAARQSLVDLDADGAIRRIQLLIALGGDFTPAAPQQTASAGSAAVSNR